MKMTTEVKQEYTANNQNSLVLLTSENGKPKDFIGHIVNYGQQKVWAPYKVGDELDFEPTKERWPKLVVAGYNGIDSIQKELHSSDGLLFLLADGEFPMGCGPSRDLNTVLAVKPGAKDAREISDQIYRDIGTDLEFRAKGMLNITKKQLLVNNFCVSYISNPDVYLDTIAGLTRSSIAPDGISILFKANLK
jgi:hypothetical protein